MRRGNAPCRLGRRERCVSFLVPAPDPALISAAHLRGKSNGRNRSVSVIRLFIRETSYRKQIRGSVFSPFGRPGREFAILNLPGRATAPPFRGENGAREKAVSRRTKRWRFGLC